MTADHTADAPGTVRATAEAYWRAFLESQPLYASLLGDHRFDDRADDLSIEAEQERRRHWVELRDRARAVPEDGLAEVDAITRDLLIGELTDNIRAVDARLVELTSDQMQGAHATLLVGAGQLQAPEPEHARMAVARVDAMARMLDQAAQRYRDGVAAGRTPARINVTRSRNQVEGYLASPLEQDPFVNLAGPADWAGEREWRSQLSDAVRETLRPAFARYRDVFATELEPVARPDERAGLAHIADGDEIYQALIELHTGLPLTADELHEIGLEQATRSIRAEFADVGERVFGTSNVAEIFERMLGDADLRYRHADELLAHARSCLEKATGVMDDWFGILPQAPCELIPVPDYLAADVPPAYYLPPAADGSRPGTYNVNLHNPTEQRRYQTAAIAYHEAIPGHHLQLAIATERTDLPQFRRMGVGHTAYIEGWGLYTERLADEMGLYADDLDRLGMLASDAWRACRLVVDTGLHARGWSRQQAIDFMTEYAPIDPVTIAVEVDRYIGMPGQALAYKVGQREILEQRAEAEAKLGARFDLKGFHDAVLGAATISLPVLRRRVASWIAERS
ncbi:DUF885 domain-containing protein [Phytoactinopolyspora halotolerans]|uniref:DUF885 domain-containing protein n=1 Tax=Phytoactinopolyspora halotolerans TaxID=1981512 RepID=A0A6L9SAS9_9ACTN|nr:DUF885 domain-containing protein [Phytoactinopolyspora halotolerans]NEE01682.1 DUF885 domain-containing protein [Phytoactinopolyspora halotolerans]